MVLIFGGDIYLIFTEIQEVLLKSVNARGWPVVELGRCWHDAVLEQLSVAGADRGAVGLTDHLAPVLRQQLRQDSLHLPVQS